MPLVTEPINCDESVKRAIRAISRKLGYTGSPTYAGMTLTGLTASSLVGTDASKALESVTIGTSLTYTRPTLNTIQGIRTVDSPTFANLNLTETGANDPTILFTSATNSLSMMLDESAGYDMLHIAGKTAATDTVVCISAVAGRTARFHLEVAAEAFRTQFLMGAGGNFSLTNKVEDGDLIFGIDNTGTDKTITWDGATDKLKHSANTFNFDDDHLVTTGNVEAHAGTFTNTVFINQDADGVGLEIDSEATTDTNYGLKCVTGQGAISAYFSSGPSCYMWIGSPQNIGNAGSVIVTRDLASANTDGPVMYINQSNAGDDQDGLYLRQDGSGSAMYIEKGSLSIAAGVTIDGSSGKVLVEDNALVAPTDETDGYIGVAVVAGEPRIYFQVEGDLYFVSNDGIALAPVVGNPLGLLLALTYT